MFIINKKNEIFNTDCIPEITTNGAQVLAMFGNTPRPISYNPDSLTTIADAIRDGRDYVEVD